MSIHDFYSKLVSGKEEDRLFEALRRLRKIENPALATEGEPAHWTIWSDDSTAPYATASA